MNWYYAINGENRGPVGDDEFQRLVQQGVITGETLVWREGMANWAPYRGTASNLPAAGLQDSVACAMCGRGISRSDAFVLSGVSYCVACKPQIIQRLKEGVPIASSDAEEMRKLHVSHEASVKSVGILYYLGGAAMLFGGLGMTASSLSSSKGPESIAVVVVLFVLAGAYIWVGYGLRRLRRWARITTGILAGIGLLGFPLGTIINAYILYLICSKKGATVFSPEYQEVIRQTPHIKYKTSIVVWILLGIVLLVIVAIVTAAIFSKH